MYSDANGMLQDPSNVFQWNIIEGLLQNNVDFTLASVPAFPAWPNYRHVLTPHGTMILNGEEYGHYLSYCDIPFYKEYSQRRVLRNYLRQWCNKNANETQLFILVYSQWPQHLGAALDLKGEFPQLTVATIITDVIENALEYASNRSFFKRILIHLAEKEEQKMFPLVDKYILLTKYMEESIVEAVGRNIVVEGISSSNKIDMAKKPTCEDLSRTILYTGVLERYAGVDQMVDAFMMTKDERFRLVICGSGTSEDYICKSAKKDSRIVFNGHINHSEVIQYQKKATVLINPRRPNGKITKFSFPSKTMEYMMSGTPMIGYKLEGIPDDYYFHMYIPKSLSVEDLASCINDTLTLPAETLEEKALSAMQFVANNKNPKVQVKKIIEFLKR